MDVPPFTSPPWSQFGTVEYATPGATMSGLASSPPRELHQPSASVATPNWNCANEAGYTAPTAMASSADPGSPSVDVPGPSLPAAIEKNTSGWAIRKSSMIESIAARPSFALPTPKDMLSTSGSRRPCA